MFVANFFSHNFSSRATLNRHGWSWGIDASVGLVLFKGTGEEKIEIGASVVVRDEFRWPERGLQSTGLVLFGFRIDL